jgi:hypothetical protein
VDVYLDSMSRHEYGRSDLTNHPGRPPNMTPILKSVAMRNAGTGTTTGIDVANDAVFEIEYDAGDLVLERAFIGIHNASGDRVATASTSYCPNFRGPVKGAGRLECRLPALPLVPGEYSVMVAVSVSLMGNITDQVEGALHFRVNSWDYFGTGATLLPGQGFFVQQSEWRRL